MRQASRKVRERGLSAKLAQPTQRILFRKVAGRNPSKLPPPANVRKQQARVKLQVVRTQRLPRAGGLGRALAQRDKFDILECQSGPNLRRSRRCVRANQS